MNVLMVLTSHDRLGETGEQTGFWLEEFAAPYYTLRDGGASVTLASPKGGQPPVDPRSSAPEAQTDATRRFNADTQAQAQLASTKKLSEIDPAAFDAVFYPGGHGPLWDLAQDTDSIRLVEQFYAAGKPVSAVCHGPAAFKDAKAPDGSPLVRGKDVTGFSDAEEAAVKLTDVVPFSVEQMLKNNGGKYQSAPAFEPFALTDGTLITGQNPASSEITAQALLTALKTPA